jgi:acetyltransferase
VNAFDLRDFACIAGRGPALIRALAPPDAAHFQSFVRALSPHSRRMRFQNGVSELPPGLLDSLLRPGEPPAAALVALAAGTAQERIVGEARYAPSLDRPDAVEIAFAVADDWQRRGLGAALVARLIAHARAAGAARMHGDVLQENAPALRLLRRFGFAARRHPDGAWLARMELELLTPSALPRSAGRESPRTPVLSC